MSKGIKFKNKNNEPVYPCPYFPVGHIYLSTTNIDPGEYFGGTWRRISSGRFLISCGVSQDENTTNYFGELNGSGINYPAGEKAGQVYHRLTANELPSSGGHTILLNDTGSQEPKWCFGEIKYYNSREYKLERGMGTGNEKHNNMPPYLAVYMWERTG